MYAVPGLQSPVVLMRSMQSPVSSPLMLPHRNLWSAISWLTRSEVLRGAIPGKNPVWRQARNLLLTERQRRHRPKSPQSALALKIIGQSDQHVPSSDFCSAAGSGVAEHGHYSRCRQRTIPIPLG